MHAPTESRFVDRLTREIEDLLRDVLAFEASYSEELDNVDPDFRDSARNLLHYLGVRRHDIRRLQDDLSSLGLSSLGRMEAHTLATLQAVAETLRRLGGGSGAPPPEFHAPVQFRAGPALLADHANALLGPQAPRRSGRVMVTMPSEAATDAGLIRRLLEAGMNVMRINCAHDDADAWVSMVENLRSSERSLGKGCRILADLGGPKLRTGAILGAERVQKIRSRRDVRGAVVAKARIWLTPTESVEPPPPDATATLPVGGNVLAKARPGDTLEVADCRGKLRELGVVERRESSRLAECARTIYVETGSPVRLKRDGKVVGEGLVGPLPETAPSITLHPGDRLRVMRDGAPGRPAVLDGKGRVREPASIPCTLAPIFDKVRAGERIWFDDGKIGGNIVEVGDDAFTVELVHAKPTGTKLRADKGINLPDTTFDLPALTEKDYRDLDAVAPHVDMIGLSFVRRPEDIELLEQRFNELDAHHLGIVLKIENRRAFERLPRILLTALRSPPVGVMVARGDLAVEVGFERLAEVQEEILWMCEAAHVPVIWATQVLEGLAKSGAPSRAEVTDAAMSGRAECVMLNKGPYIVEATRFLCDVLERMDAHQSKKTATLRRLSVSQMT